MQKWIFIVGLCGLLSCEKNIDFDLIQTDPVLVVDAEVENNIAPTVVLTRSLSYFSQISPDILASSFVHNADVFISNGTVTNKMKEQAYPLFPGLTAYVYTIDSTNTANIFAGTLNTRYNLRIVSEGKEYNSTILLPALIADLDSIWTKPAPQNPDTNKRVLFIRGSDPVGRGNYLRYFTKVNSEPFFPGYNSVFDDQIIDGTTFEVQLQKGVDRNNLPKADSNFYNKGDTITLKFCNIEKPVYTFWSTWEFAYQSIGNPFAQPNKVVGNVSNGALGAFCGYAARYYTIVAK